MFTDGGAQLEPIPALPRLSCVARLSAQKGLPLLVDAAALVHQRGQNFHLTLVGDGDMRGEIEAMIARHGLDDKITITGWCDAAGVRQHLLASRAMILPSFAEGLPVVIMEALALGRPVIVSAIAGTPELVDHDCGWLVPAGAIEPLAAAMAAALTAPPAALEAMGAEGSRRVRVDHDAQANGAGLLAAIRHAHGLDR
jgi:colanic acid/amylovoran biosynthesis glycosyltransferase